MVWLKFVACVVVIFFAGSKAAQYGDIIAEKSGLGRIRIGMLLLGVVTSMPELVTSVSAVSMIKDANLGFSTLIGTIIFNLCILTILDTFHRPKPVLSRVRRRHVRLVAVGIISAIIIAVGILLEPRVSFLSIGWLGLLPVLVFVFYLVATFRISHGEHSNELTAKPAEKLLTTGGISWLSLAVKFVFSAIAIVGAGVWLSYIGEEIAVETGWGASFVGSLLLAITTSLPEITVAIAAIRLGAMDLAVADILGANMLDIAYIFIADIFYIQGPILSAVSKANLVILAVFIIMNLVVIVGLRYQKDEKTFKIFSWYTPVLIGLYILGAFVLFIAS